MQSLRYVQTQVTKACNSIKEVIESTEEKLGQWSAVEIGLEAIQPDIRGTIHLLEAKIKTLNNAMDKFLEAADGMNDPDEPSLKKIDENITKSTELIDAAHGLRDRTEVELMRTERHEQQPRHDSTQQHVIVEQTQPRVYGQNIGGLAIPKPPKFKGDRTEFENFWTLFQASVETSGQNDIYKFNHLLNALEGEPKELLKQFKLTAENYQRAVDLLQKKYWDKKRVITDLTRQLRTVTSSSGSTSDQRKLLDTITIIMSQLCENRGKIDADLTKDIILEKFHMRFREKIEDMQMDDEVEWTIEKLIEKLDAVITREEKLNTKLNRSENSSKSKSQDESKSKAKHQDKEKDKERQKKCTFCKKDGHWGSECRTISTVKERTEIIKKEERCLQCFQKGHRAQDCKRKPCYSCKEAGHNSAICPSKPKDSQTDSSAQKKEADKNKQKSKTTAVVQIDDNSDTNTQSDEDEKVDRNEGTENPTATTLSTRRKKAFIPTLRTMAFNPRTNKWEKLSIMLDSGADQTYITSTLAKKWKLPSDGEEPLRIRTFGSAKAKECTLTRSEIRIKVGDKEMDMNVYVSGHLAGRVMKAELTPDDMNYALRRKIELNEDALERNVEPEMIIGCDYIGEIWTGERTTLPSGIDIIRTVLGFTTMGKQKIDNKNAEDTYKESSIISMAIEELTDQDIEEQQKRDMKMKTKEEFTGPTQEEKWKTDQETWKFFKETIEKRDNGYHVQLPFKNNHQKLPDNYSIAFKRLQSVYKNSSKEVLEMIDAVFKDQESKGIIKEVDPKQETTNPHQPVITPHKTTTKCRVVIDGGAHFKNELALNDVIFQGPVILPDIVDMLIRFRAGKHVIISDVEKAFLQVFLHEKDRDVTRVLWLRDITKPPTPDNIVVYHSSRVLFGLNVSPFLLGATILHHLDQIEDKQLAEEMKKNLYVDNLILTTDGDPDEMEKIYRKVKETFSQMNMNLREFLSNSAEFNLRVDEKDRAQEKIMKVLGILWNSEKDSIHMKVSWEEMIRISRRTVSSSIASIYDPIGILVPILLQLKLFQRELWAEDYDWDTPLTEQHKEQWKEIMKARDGFECELPRNVIMKSEGNIIVTFADASKDATACCSYILNKNGSNFLVGKGKVKPKKENWTIPKLEIQAIKMGANKTVEIVKALRDGKIQVDRVVILSDSTIALGWLQSSPGKKEVGVFISNRLTAIRNDVQEIEGKGVPVQFGHVRSEENPADLGTRGSDRDSFPQTTWWKGPEFLQKGLLEWDENLKLFPIGEDCHMLVAKSDQEDFSEVFNCEVTNRYKNMIRISAYTFKFIGNASKNLSEETKRRMEQNIPFLKTESSPEGLNAQEIKAAEVALIKDQQRMFDEKKLKDLGNLGLIKNSSGLIVCKGRMELSELDESAKLPILILPDTALGKQIIGDRHGKHHNGLEYTMDSFRREFWMPRLRQQVKKYISKCVPCQKVNKAAVRYPDFGRLPEERVKRSKPFANCGLDNFGPIKYKKEDGTLGEAFGTIFTCSVTRLTHIEIVTNTSAAAFLMALRRFVATRGCPQRIVSDNGPNFVLGQKILDEAMTKNELPDEVKEFLGIEKIEWKFITPYSPWKGGMYEVMVKVSKQTFVKGHGKNPLSLEELTTSYKEVEASINGRPLTFPEDDINAALPIRPMDFVNQEIKISIPWESVMDITDEYLPSQELQSAESKRDAIEYLKSSVEATAEIWKRWNSKYLAELREHHRTRMDNKRGSRQLPVIDQIVLICDEDKHRNYWKLGRITELVKSSDAVVREVKLRTKNGRILRRSINMIVPLELDEEPDEKETSQPDSQTEEVKETVQNPVEPRYNLRNKKKVNYNEEQTDNQSFSALSFSTNGLFLTLMTMMMIIGAAGSQASVECSNHGLRIYGQYTEFKVCVKDFCTKSKRLQWMNQEYADIWIPPTLKLKGHHATVKIAEDKTITDLEIDCPAVKFCETIDCTFCFNNILNPECHIYFAILGLGAAIFAMLMIVHIICNVPVTLGAPFRIGWRMGRLCCNAFCGAIRTVTQFRRTRFRKPKWYEPIVILTIIFCITPKLEACQEIDVVTQFKTVCNNDETGKKCETFTEEMISLNGIQKEGCLRITNNGTVIRDIRVQLLEIQLHCYKETVTYTQNVEVKVWSSKRCPRMGSCTEDKCANVTRETLIPELTMANQYIGNTGCVESCGGAGCGCFYLSSGCLFYRIFAKPKSDERMEIFRCMEYQPVASLRIVSTKLNSYKNLARKKDVQIQVGKAIAVEDITITVDSIQTPTSPILNSWFIRQENATATWTENNWPVYQCKDKKGTCQLHEKCTCTPAEVVMRCTCEDEEIDTLFQRIETRLPVQKGLWKLERMEEKILARTQSSISATVAMKIDKKWRTTVIKSSDVCRAEVSQAQGCYSCEGGAQVEVTCTSKRTDTMANVDCGEDVFTVPCNTGGIKTILTFLSDKAKFRRNCLLQCGSKQNQEFEVHGVLKYSGSLWTSMYHILNGNSTMYAEINLPDIGHILDSYLSYMKTVAIALIIVAVGFISTYAIIVSTGKTIVRKSIRMIGQILWLPFRILIGVYFFVQRRRAWARHKSNRHTV